MKKLILLATILLMPTICSAQCVAEVKKVKIDESRGSIIVETQYKLNGIDVQLGRTRYDETSGNISDIDLKLKNDIEQHCSAIISREENNAKIINMEMLDIAKSKTLPMLNDLSELVVGKTYTINKAELIFKDKKIEVTSDGQKTVSGYIDNSIIKE